MTSYSKKEQELLTQFGNTLKMHRISKGISQEKLAEHCELHRTYIGSAERGERNVSLLNMSKIANALGLKVGDLISSK